MIVCDKLSKVYDDYLILDNINQSFNDCGFYLLFGESGSGKTTFLNALAGFVPFEAGSISWNGLIFTEQVDAAEIENAFDYITQDAFFIDFLSVMDNLRLSSEDDKQILEFLKKFGLEGTANRLPSTLSGGERQRLALIRALLSGKKVLFLDEPTASLDEDNKLAVFSLLAQIKTDVLIICASHDEAAKVFADGIIPFSKQSHQKAAFPAYTVPKKRRQASLHKVNGRKLTPFLRKWFHSDHRSRKSGTLFTSFLVLALCLCMLADLPQHKMDATIEHIYKLNYFTVKTVGGKRWEQIAPDSDEIVEVVLDYSHSCPDGSEGLSPDTLVRPMPNYELVLPTLPYCKEAFRLSDRLLAGSYFTDAKQVILSWEMASALRSDAPEKLIGNHIAKTIYGKGTVDFEIVGILGKFNDVDRQYLNGMGCSIATGSSYDPRDYEGLFFVSGKLIEELEQDPTFFMGAAKQRTYRVFFKSYQSMRAYYEKYAKAMTSDRTVTIEYSNIDVQLENLFLALCCILIPIAVFMALFTVLFYAALRKTEFVYSSQFVAVFEYLGYPKRKVIRQFILLNLWDLIKSCMVSLVIALGITGMLNLINEQLLLLNFRIFSYNPMLIAAFLAVILVSSWASVNVLFRRVRISSWYDIVRVGRDLI